MPDPGEETILKNLWLCEDQETDGIDNDGDSTVDDEPADLPRQRRGVCSTSMSTCSRASTATRATTTTTATASRSTARSPTAAQRPYVGSDPRPECPQPTLQDYVD